MSPASTQFYIIDELSSTVAPSDLMGYNVQMVKFTIIIGLPGSGKTTLAKSMLNHQNILLDDLSMDMHEGVVRFAQSNKKNVIITDPRLCGVAEEQIAQVIRRYFGNDSEQFDFEFIYFENDPEACLVNAKRDPKPGGAESFIKMMTKYYTIPEGAVTIPVYKSS